MNVVIKNKHKYSQEYDDVISYQVGEKYLTLVQEENGETATLNCIKHDFIEYFTIAGEVVSEDRTIPHNKMSSL